MYAYLAVLAVDCDAHQDWCLLVFQEFRFQHEKQNIHCSLSHDIDFYGLDIFSRQAEDQQIIYSHIIRPGR